MCTGFALYMNDELRAMTKNQRSFARAMMRSSLMPSEKYSCSVSPLRFVNGSTAIAGRSSGGDCDPMPASALSDADEVDRSWS
jgi:hypothetical protein